MAAAVTPAVAQQVDTARELPPYEQLQLLSSALNQIRANYIDSVKYGQLVGAAIRGMLQDLDPHSYFMSRREWQRWTAYERGELAGVGVALEQEDSVSAVLGVIPGSPAAKAGIQSGDRVAAINDTAVVGLRATDVALRLAGPKGSKIVLRVERGPRLDPDTFSVILTRDALKRPPTVISGLADATTGLVWLAWFGPAAAEELRDTVRGLQNRGARRLILDLRDNPGGIVQAAVDIATEFLPKGTLVFRTKGRKADATKDFVTARDGAFRDLPLIVLINERSASASEALAGSLQDHDRALIIGRRSFGKALVQTGFLLTPTGDMVMLTIARVLTPSGRVIQRRYRGLGYEQYLSFAGRSGAAEDTLAVFRTDHGREVRGGGGILPDVALPVATVLPIWWSVATDSGFDVAVADSVAATLPQSPSARERWMSDATYRSAQLLPPFLERARTRLHVSARPDSTLAARLELQLAMRAAAVRWPPEGGNELRLRNDPDIRIALTYFPRLPSLLGAAVR